MINIKKIKTIIKSNTSGSRFLMYQSMLLFFSIAISTSREAKLSAGSGKNPGFENSVTNLIKW